MTIRHFDLTLHSSSLSMIDDRAAANHLEWAAAASSEVLQADTLHMVPNATVTNEVILHQNDQIVNEFVNDRNVSCPERK